VDPQRHPPLLTATFYHPYAFLRVYFQHASRTRKGVESRQITKQKDKLHQQKVECKYCEHVFVANASQIREHTLHLSPACGVVNCTAVKQFCSLSWMRYEPSMIRARQQQQQQQQQQRSTSSTESTAATTSTTSVPAKKLRTLAQCRKAASKA